MSPALTQDPFGQCHRAVTTKNERGEQKWVRECYPDA